MYNIFSFFQNILKKNLKLYLIHYFQNINNEQINIFLQSFEKISFKKVE